MTSNNLQFLINQADIINEINELWSSDNCTGEFQYLKQIEYAELYAKIDLDRLKSVVIELSGGENLEKKLLILHDALIKNGQIYFEKKKQFEGFDVVKLFSLYVEVAVGHKVAICKGDIKEVQELYEQHNDPSDKQNDIQNLEYFKKEFVRAQIDVEEFQKREGGVFLKNYYLLIQQKVNGFLKVINLFAKDNDPESLNLFNIFNIEVFVELIRRPKVYLKLTEGNKGVCAALNTFNKRFDPNINKGTINTKRFGFLIKKIGEKVLTPQQLTEWQASICKRIGLTESTFANPALNSNDKNERKGFWKEAKPYLFNHFEIDLGDPKFRDK